ncbi:MAG: DJ-1/PfpI family protein [Bacteroidaceae bacterium]
MKIIHLFLATGFEETEAIQIVDIIRRAGLEIHTVSITDSKQVLSSHDILITADELIAEANLEESQLFILPGGMPGATNLSKCDALRSAIITHFNTGKLISAICAAPLVYGLMGLLEGKRATCYPGFEEYLKGAQCTGSLVEIDGNIITGKGPAAAMPFAFALVERLAGKELTDSVKAGMLYSELVK